VPDAPLGARARQWYADAEVEIAIAIAIPINVAAKQRLTIVSLIYARAFISARDALIVQYERQNWAGTRR
jgi:hypothetical protein